MFELEWTTEAETIFDSLKASPADKARYKAVKKALTFLAQDPKHKSLQSHPFFSLEGPNAEKVFVAYAQQKTPAAYRVFWYYGPERGVITVLAITPHP